MMKTILLICVWLAAQPAFCYESRYLFKNNLGNPNTRGQYLKHDFREKLKEHQCEGIILGDVESTTGDKYSYFSFRSSNCVVIDKGNSCPAGFSEKPLTPDDQIKIICKVTDKAVGQSEGP